MMETCHASDTRITKKKSIWYEWFGWAVLEDYKQDRDIDAIRMRMSYLSRAIKEIIRE